MRLFTSLLSASLTLAALSPSQTLAAEKTWDNGWGGFAWDLFTPNWSVEAVWSDGDDAIFGPDAVGTVFLGSPVAVHHQTFNAAGYTITGAGNAMTLVGTNPTITANADATNAASLHGTNGLTIQGTGVLALKGDPAGSGNQYTGGTYVRSGTLLLGVQGASASGTSYAVDSIEALDAGATVKFDTIFDGTSYVSPSLHQVATHSTAFPSRLRMTGGTFDLNNEPRNQRLPIPEGTGLIINTGTNVQSGLILVADGQDHEFSGVIADGGPLVGDNNAAGPTPQGPGRQIGIVNIAAGINGGGGVWTLSGSNTYSGSTRLQFGSIKLARGGTIGFPTSNGLTGPLRIYGPSFLDLNGHNQTIALMQNGNADGKVFNSGVGTVSTLTFGYGNEESPSRNASFQFMDNQGTGGVLALTKIGATCIQTLSGVNTYSGDTTVSEGTLAFATTTAVSPNSTFRLSTGATLALNYTGDAPVRQLFVDGVQKPRGTYGAETAPITGTGTITVMEDVPASLGFAFSDGTLSFSWQGAYKLQSATNNILGPWFDFPNGGTSPVNVTVDPSNGSVFFRLSN
jgi:fibronectin-binding autotransporter adhesin